MRAEPFADLTVISELSVEESFWHMCNICITTRSYLNWTLADLERFFLPPIEHGYVRFFGPSSEKSDISAFCTWAWLTPNASQLLREQHLDPTPEDWSGGTELWITDLVAKDTNLRSVANYLKFEALRGSPSPFAFALRRDAAGKVRKIARWQCIQ
ncbi:toxin-activating lysine-acyltransferase [Rhizobium sp. C4]|uniref:toxin-activating lysine-acyltransferase n=1 Tax=Rhizobium sp. C4 TaxID=1349800 RepID=UPI001E585113|nr:toxin-activating lysine-acyltransferase [Rhizobium sp. C4]MCD2175099.1 toxin-activating lysine-acyltransferase [Rhizobium sp. C4]